MLVYPTINPVALSIGPLKIHWYGLMYLFGFLVFLYGGKYRLKRYGNRYLTAVQMDEYLFYAALGVILGGRIGYCLMYQPGHFIHHPLDIVRTWNGGMAFHGGLLGVCLAVYLFARKIHAPFLALMDFASIFVPVGLLFGRIGNFINGELWGRLCSPTLLWGMVFPNSGSLMPRHPSQLYEAISEGLGLLLMMLWFNRKPRRIGESCSFFTLCYGIIRFGLEYFREPDAFAMDIVYRSGLSLGQIYSLPMIVIGGLCWYLASRGVFEPQANTSL
jgi:phosphatidylglycerol:prolipoprotein diacylglycerol transferase